VPTQAQIDQFARMNDAARAAERARDARLSPGQRIEEAMALSEVCAELKATLGRVGEGVQPA